MPSNGPLPPAPDEQPLDDLQLVAWLVTACASGLAVRLRQLAGWSTYRASDHAAVPRVAVVAWEACRLEPSGAAAARYAALLHAVAEAVQPCRARDLERLAEPA